MTVKPRPLTLREVQNLAFTIIFGLAVGFFIWYASYLGWGFGNPRTPFVIETIEHGEALSWSQLKAENPNILPDSRFSKVQFNLSRHYWDKVIYPKNLFVFHVEVENTRHN